MEILIICLTVLLLTVAILLFLFFSRPYEDEIIQTQSFKKEGFDYKEIQTIQRTYKNGTKKIITKHIYY